MCNEPYIPKTATLTGSASSVDRRCNPAIYESPFGEDRQTQSSSSATSNNTHASARVKSRTKPRTPFVQSAPQMTQLKRPRSRRMMNQTTEANNQDDHSRSNTNTSFYMFLSLPNTPDTDELMNSNSARVILGTESYLWKEEDNKNK